MSKWVSESLSAGFEHSATLDRPQGEPPLHEATGLGQKSPDQDASGENSCSISCIAFPPISSRVRRSITDGFTPASYIASSLTAFGCTSKRNRALIADIYGLVHHLDRILSHKIFPFAWTTWKIMSFVSTDTANRIMAQPLPMTLFMLPVILQWCNLRLVPFQFWPCLGFRLSALALFLLRNGSILNLG